MKYSEEYWNSIESVISCINNVDALKGKSLFITGGTGMICSSVIDVLLYLNRHLSFGLKIIIAARSVNRVRDRFHGFEEGSDYYFVEYDATRQLDIDIDADYIIHGASNATPATYSKEPVETMLANVIGLNELLKKASECNCSRLLYISSSEVYGNNSSNKPYKEDDYGFVDILNPRACYPVSKRAAETLCATYGAEYGVDCVIVRPGHIYGPTITQSDNRASAQFTRDVIVGRDIVMKSAGAQLRSYCYTLDCASAILAVLINGEHNNAYNISNSSSIVSIRQFAEELASHAGCSIVFENPTDVEKKSYNLMSNSSLDSEKIESLGWKASFSIQEGIRQTIDLLKYQEE